MENKTKEKALKKILAGMKNSKMAMPGPEFKHSLREKLIQKQNKNGRVPSPRAFQIAFAVIFLLLTTSSGLVFASQKSLPEDLLYPIKIASEKFALAAASPFPELKNKISSHVENRRTEESEKLNTAAEEENVNTIQDEKPEAQERVEGNTEKSRETLEGVLEKTPEEAKKGLERSIDNSNNLKAPEILEKVQGVKDEKIVDQLEDKLENLQEKAEELQVP